MKNKTNMQNKKGVGLWPSGAPLRSGFTLIELLVVVLIIGILAAVAVPQYKKAVLKSRVAQAWPMLKAIEEAGQAYYLANDGTYPTTFGDLDLGFTDKNGNVVTGSSFAASDYMSFSLRAAYMRNSDAKVYTCSSDGQAPIGYATFTFDSSTPFGSFILLMCGGKRYCEIPAPGEFIPAGSLNCKDIGLGASAPGLQCFSAIQNCFTE